MDFPIQSFMDEDACFRFLLDLFHPKGLHCPRCQAQDGFAIHRYVREPVLDYRCTACGRVFNAWTGTVFQGTHYRPSTLILIIRGFAQGVSTAQLARELGCSRRNLLKLRHNYQSMSKSGLDREPLKDTEVEADEMYQNAGEKGVPHLDPDDPPRRRANKRRGHGTMENDRPPVVGVVGRQSGEGRFEVVDNADQKTLENLVISTTTTGATVYTDEWSGYNHLPELGRNHSTVCHTPGRREWARDDDGDGVREVHNNTLEGIWTGVRNFLRIFRGVNKDYLGQYIAIFEWAYKIKAVTLEFLRAFLGMKASTNLSP
jgi:transposase-like protein